MRVVASADLKGLGAKDGPAEAYEWKLPNPLPRLLPWLLLLGLLCLRPNRTGRAWLVWLPLLACFALAFALRPALSFIPSEPLDMLCQCVLALAFGTAALWLTLPLLTSQHRLVAFLKGVAVLVPAAAVAYATSQDWGALGPEFFAGWMALGLLALALLSALALSGWNSRRRYRPVRLVLWLLIWLMIATTVILAPFAAFALLSGGSGALAGFGAAILVGAAMNLVVLLPFLVLAFASSFYRERLQRYLRMEIPAPPPVTPPPSVTTSTP